MEMVPYTGRMQDLGQVVDATTRGQIMSIDQCIVARIRDFEGHLRPSFPCYLL